VYVQPFCRYVYSGFTHSVHINIRPGQNGWKSWHAQWSVSKVERLNSCTSQVSLGLLGPSYEVSWIRELLTQYHRTLCRCHGARERRDSSRFQTNPGGGGDIYYIPISPVRDFASSFPGGSCRSDNSMILDGGVVTTPYCSNIDVVQRFRHICGSSGTFT
jgi:hypothetical protein